MLSSTVMHVLLLLLFQKKTDKTSKSTCCKWKLLSKTRCVFSLYNIYIHIILCSKHAISNGLIMFDPQKGFPKHQTTTKSWIVGSMTPRMTPSTQDLLDFLASESCTVLNVTHVFDACEGWTTGRCVFCLQKKYGNLPWYKLWLVVWNIFYFP